MRARERPDAEVAKEWLCDACGSPAASGVPTPPASSPSEDNPETSVRDPGAPVAARVVRPFIEQF